MKVYHVRFDENKCCPSCGHEVEFFEKNITGIGYNPIGNFPHIAVQSEKSSYERFSRYCKTCKKHFPLVLTEMEVKP